MVRTDSGSGSIRFGRGNWQEVSHKRRCPICGKPDWCLITSDGSAVICPRTPKGATKDLGASGYLHILNERPWRLRARSVSRSIPLVEIDRGWDELVDQFAKAVDSKRLLGLADSLGLTEESLRRLKVGWSRDHQAWTFPMVSALGIVRGIRLRCPDGRKLSIRGGHEGLFIPSEITGTTLLIAEGPTDSAALLDLGFAVIGRPSCRGAVKRTAVFVRSFGPSEIVIVADRDEAGRSGADSLGSTLIAYARRLRIITPPHEIKDARAWKAAGATHKDVRSAIEAAAVRSFSTTTGGTSVRR